MKVFTNKNLTYNNKKKPPVKEEEGLKKALRLSDLYYNEGLKRAKIRDLSGATSHLKTSLKLNKANTNARNLLGLIYSEMGDTVSALSEWVISKHFKEKDNGADYYLSYYQMNPTRLDAANKVIKKYNSAIKSIYNDGEDLAIIQLKKVIALNPKHLKALQLISLLYLKNKKYFEAKKYIEEAKKIDICNPTTLLYLSELEKNHGVADRPKEVREERVLFADSDSFAPASSYKEDKPSILPWINLVIGIALGAAFFVVAMLPGIKAKSVEGKMAEIVSLNENLATANADLSRLEGKNAELVKEIEFLRQKTKEKPAEETKETDDSFRDLISSLNYFFAGDEKLSAEYLIKVDKQKLMEEGSGQLYDSLSQKVFEKQSKENYAEARRWYNKGRFDKALPKFEEAFKMNPQFVDAAYFVGRSYHRLNEKEKAKEWYQKVVEEFPTGPRAPEAAQKLRQLGGN